MSNSFIFVVFVCGLYPCTVGLPKSFQRIVGGRSTEIIDLPYQVALIYKGKFSCGGSILSPNYILTAAHCTRTYLNASKLKVRVGSTHSIYGGLLIKVAQIHQHSKFNNKTMDYDISILELSDSLMIGSGVGVIGLPDLNQSTPAGTEADISGWGHRFENDTLYPIDLQVTSVTVISKSSCSFLKYNHSITDRMVCAGDWNCWGKDACNGDSGGPLVVDNEVIGIVSWGAGCGRRYRPGVYADVAKLRLFIKEITGI